MAGYAAEKTIGSRIAAARRARGFRSTRELAAAMAGTGLTESVLENLESDRRANIDVSHVLNIARTLGVPVVSLLAPMARPEDLLDLPNLGPLFTNMTAAEFDAWLGSIPNSSYTASTNEERSDRAELQALRELQSAQRELRRLESSAALEDHPEQPESLRLGLDAQLDGVRARIDGLRKFLTSVGWEV
jgi:transcriptional regulator with XRE-family HTH domain